MHHSKIIRVLVLWQCSLLVPCSSSSSSWSDWLWWLADPDQSSVTLDQDPLGRQDTAPFEDDRLLSRKGTSLCGPSVFNPVGECRHYGKCLASGGEVDVLTPGCNALFAGCCCKYVAGCNAKLTARVAFWQSQNYPAEATGSTSCTLYVQPRSDTCFVRVQFLDTLLTASTVDNCDGNILTINNQAEGDSSLICGSLDNYETIVRIRSTPWKLNFSLLENLRLDLKIRDTRYKYNIKITQVTCSQINGIAGGVTSQSIDFSGRSSYKDLLDANPKQITPTSNQKKYIHLKEKYKDRILELNFKDSDDLATSLEKSEFLSNVVDSGAIQSETTTPAIMNFVTTKMPLHLGLGISDTMDLVTSLTSQLDQTHQEIVPMPNQSKYIHLKEKYKDRILELNSKNSTDFAMPLEKGDFFSSVVDSGVFQGETSTPAIMDFETTNVPLYLDLDNSDTMDLVTSFTSQLDQTHQEIIQTPNQSRYIHLKEKYKDRILELNSKNSADFDKSSEKGDLLSNVVGSGGMQGETSTPAILDFEKTKVPLHLNPVNSETMDLMTTLASQLHQTHQDSFPTSNQKYIHLKEKYKDRILELNSMKNTELSTMPEGDDVLINTDDFGVLQSGTSSSAITNFEKAKAPPLLDSGNLDTADLVTSLTLQLDQINQEASGSSTKFPSTDSPQQLDTLNQTEIFPILVLSEVDSETTNLPIPENIESQTATEENDATNSTVDLVELIRLASESGLLNYDGKVSLEALCSVVEREATQRIATAGTNVLRGRAPYFGSVMIRNEADHYLFCGATLIAPTYVLTAASCLLRQGYDSNMYDIRAYFDNVNDLGGIATRTYTTMWARTPQYKVKRVVFHPMYDHNNFHYDVAVLELDTAVTAPNTPIALPQRGDLYGSEPVVEMGFGLTQGQTLLSAKFYADRALFTRATTITNAACQSLYDSAPRVHTSYTGQFIKDEMICASPGANNQQVCEGDQGGPMVANFDGKAVLVGIISGNQHNCIHPELGSTLKLGQYPDIAVRITSVLDFINAATTTIQYDVGAGSGGVSFWDIFKGFWTVRIA